MRDDGRLARDNGAKRSTYVPRIYLIVHSLDSASSISSGFRDVVLELAQCPQIHILVSIDTPSGAAIIDKTVPGTSRWRAIHTPTFVPYQRETYSTRIGLTDVKKTASRAALRHILSSLTKSHISMLEKLAKSQVSLMAAISGARGTKTGISKPKLGRGRPPKNSTDESVFLQLQGRGAHGVSYNVWMEDCISEMIVTTDASFRKQLRELTEQGLVRLTKDPNAAGDVCFIPFTVDEIERDIIHFVP